jgi:3-hydroxyacyl-CoA dehydrogenase
MRQISRAAVVGAGTMGAAIAAHLANAGRTVLLLDAVPGELTPAEQARGLTLQSPQVRNRLSLAGLERVKNARPPALFTPETALLITCGNVEDDLSKVAEADWIVEAVTERPDVKRALYERIETVRRPGTIVTSNTSGLPIGQLAEGRSADFRAHFLGTHFFNPPRQMKLLEVTPIPETLPDVVETIWRVGERDLGKGVVLCKDTPNFIGNRVFTFDLAFALDYALEHGYTVEEVDLLTGPLIGRPRTATFRLLDLVGIDVMALVDENLYPRVPNDESRELLRSPRMAGLVQTMVDRSWLGNKKGIGFYKEVRGPQGRAFWPLDLTTLEHRAARKPDFEPLDAIQAERDLGKRLRLLVASEGRAGAYVRAILGNLLGYASRRLPEIADDVQSVDDAMRWGFNHELGPFEIWDVLGIEEGLRLARAPSLPGTGPAPWVEAMLASGRRSFYERASSPPSPLVGEGHGERGSSLTSWNVAKQAATETLPTADALNIADRRAFGGVVAENAGASLVDLGDGVAALELHTKMNVLDERIVEMIHTALDKVAGGFQGLVITGQGEHFSAGANLMMVARLIQQQDWAGIDRATKALQDAFMALRFSPQPVVVAPLGWTLGGGAELMLAGARVVAATETYVGQVEVGIGWIPAGGGCKELLRRVVSPAAMGARPDPDPALDRVFDLIAQAKVSSSAAEARAWGFLTPLDRIVMNPDHLLATAKREVLALVEEGYQPPLRGKTIYAAGRDALAALRIKAYLFHEAAYATDHDVELANRVAYVLCGGDLSEPQWVDEQYILNLERSAVVELSQHPKTQERIRSFLETGKAVRN